MLFTISGLSGVLEPDTMLAGFQSSLAEDATAAGLIFAADDIDWCISPAQHESGVDLTVTNWMPMPPSWNHEARDTLAARLVMIACGLLWIALPESAHIVVTLDDITAEWNASPDAPTSSRTNLRQLLEAHLADIRALKATAIEESRFDGAAHLRGCEKRAIYVRVALERLERRRL